LNDVGLVSLSEVRTVLVCALGNLIGNCVATVVIAAWEGDLDRDTASSRRQFGLFKSVSNISIKKRSYLLKETSKGGLVFQDQMISAFKRNKACSRDACGHPPA
jgi:hypothetical protein